MKKLLALVLAVSAFSAFAVDQKAVDVANAEVAKTKKACVTQKDAKTGKDKEVCKTVKVHKKHEGTKVEGATKDAKK